MPVTWRGRLVDSPDVIDARDAAATLMEVARVSPRRRFVTAPSTDWRHDVAAVRADQYAKLAVKVAGADPCGRRSFTEDGAKGADGGCAC